MKQLVIFFLLTSALFSCTKTELVDVNTDNYELQSRAVASITSIGGGTASGFFSNGKWLGNVPACGQGSYYGYYVINTHEPTNATNFWTINGSNFGSTQGTVINSSSGISLTVISWSNSVIKVRPSSSYQLDYKNNVTVKVNTVGNGSPSKVINVLGMLQAGRGFGQCTWEAAYQRKAAGRSIPTPSAYSSTGNITGAYVPLRYDVLHWNGHTGIIVSNPTLTTAGTTKTYTFTLRERNENCNENSASQTTKTFKVSNGTIVSGIKSNNAGLGNALKYWR
jgi:hypothetical protein